MPGYEKKSSSLGWFSLRRKIKRKFPSVSARIEIKFKLEPVIGDKALPGISQEKTLVASQGSSLIPITYKIMAGIIHAYRYSDGSEADLLKAVNLSDKLTFNLILPSGLHRLENKSFYNKSLKELFDSLNTPQIREIANCFSKGTVIENLEDLLPGMTLGFQEFQAFLFQIEKQIYDILSSEYQEFVNRSIIQAERESIASKIAKIEKLIGRDGNDFPSEASSNPSEHHYEEILFGEDEDNLTCSGDSGYVSADIWLKNESPSPKTVAPFFAQNDESGSAKGSSVSTDSDDTYIAMSGKKP